jgi:FkbM family methyltransferase
LKKSIAGTRLEYHARIIHARIFRDEYDKQTIRVMKRILNKNSNCVDIGCNRGIILRVITRIAPNGYHYAFEPIPELYQYLVRHFPKVQVYKCALWDSKGEKTFQYIINNPPLSGFEKIVLYEPAVEIKVETKPLDMVIPESVPIHFMKIDVEGAEFQVLKGANRTINKHRPVIVFEFNLNAFNYYDTGPEDIYGFLVNECNMRISLMERWLKGEPSFNREEFSEQIHNGINGYFMAYPNTSGMEGGKISSPLPR